MATENPTIGDVLKGALGGLAAGGLGLVPRSWRVAAARRVINGQIKRYGEMTQLTIDNVNKTIRAQLMLAGEKEPIEVSVRRYELAADSVRLTGVSVSRQWMNALASDLLEAKSWPIPADKMKFLRMLL